jgi:DNA-binding response OmpR family regulator
MVTTPGEPAAGPAAGCHDTITKPIDGVELLTKVRACLGP